ncbi:hypothetical protein GCM10028803_32520 [Larkinella knui]|uniref:Uncharacterized protein n=1 Tax=Larkinella knui TaxID=2025310 RepID=A0A3P1CYQ4_9BACT|nr:hypothetical protein [Larkinella knui]RRB18268.1 hypothetical protein EHT87_08340 [Larkinella knui]
MQVLIEVPDEKAQFVIELLKHLTFVEIKDNTSLSLSPLPHSQTQHSLSPKTTSLLGSFPALARDDFSQAREEAIVKKHY